MSPLWKIFIHNHALLQRILYKVKNQHRSGKHFQYLCEAQRLLKRTLDAKYSGRHTADLPELLSYFKKATEKAYLATNQLIQLGFFLPYGLTVMALLAELRANADALQLLMLQLEASKSLIRQGNSRLMEDQEDAGERITGKNDSTHGEETGSLSLEWEGMNYTGSFLVHDPSVVMDEKEDELEIETEKAAAKREGNAKGPLQDTEIDFFTTSPSEEKTRTLDSPLQSKPKPANNSSAKQEARAQNTQIRDEKLGRKSERNEIDDIFGFLDASPPSSSSKTVFPGVLSTSKSPATHKKRKREESSSKF